MPIPAFDENGILPVGIHDCTLQELKVRFGAFHGTDQRPKLYAKLEQLEEELRTAGFGVWLIIDGSFVTAKANPNDIDLVLVLPADYDPKSDLTPAQYNLVSKMRCKSATDLI